METLAWTGDQQSLYYGQKQENIRQFFNKKTNRHKIVLECVMSIILMSEFFTTRYQNDLSGYQRDSPRVYRRKEWWICLQSCEYFARLFAVGKVMWKISFWRFSVCIAVYFEKRAVAWSGSVRASPDGIIWIWNSVNWYIFNSYPFLLRWNVIGPTCVSSISRCSLFCLYYCILNKTLLFYNLCPQRSITVMAWTKEVFPWRICPWRIEANLPSLYCKK